jgi:uncharacterized protein involved in exopolysaccharide biosynthesis
MTAVPQNQVSVSRRALDIEDYIDVARRHASWIIGPLYAAVVISTMVAFFLPNVYVSRAMLRITPSVIPTTLVPATFNQEMSDHINQMWQEVVSRGSLSELINRPTLELYKKERGGKPLEDVIEDMKRDISLEIPNNQNNTGKPNTAFVILYQYPDRFKAHDVVAALVTKLMDANQVTQRTGVNLTNEIMSDEAKAAKEELDRLDQELTAFKVGNNGRLPEQLQYNVSAMNAMQARLTSINDALQRNSAQKVMFEQQLTSLNAQYTQLEAALNTAPPEETARETVVKNDELTQLNHDILQSEANLAVLRQSFTEKHPDYIDYKAKLEALKQRRDQLRKEDQAASAAESSKPKPSAPRRGPSLQQQQALQSIKASIGNTEASLTAIEMERVNHEKEQQKLNGELATIQQRLDAAPINEQKYISLMRARGLAGEHYESLMKKQQLAAQGVEINQRKGGENLEVLETASLPETPTAPNRWRIVAIGAAAGLLAGLSMAGAKEMKDTSLKNLKDVRAYTNLPVLSSIPLLENAVLVRRKRRLAYVAWAVAVIIGLCGTAISLYYHFQIANK